MKNNHQEENNDDVWIRRQNLISRNEENEEQFQQLPIVYSPNYAVRFCGIQKLHPFDSAKGQRIVKYLTREQLILPGKFYEPTEITKEELLKVHTVKYLKSLNWSYNAAKISEIPPLLFVPNRFIQRGYLRPMRFQAAGSLLAGKLALSNGWSINLGGGFHHCSSNKGGGFCAYADITLLIHKIFTEEPHVTNAMIIDLDAHQGNGHERDFLDNSQVFILDMYNASIYPRDHNAKLAISCAVELRPHTGDAFYLKKLKSCLTKSLCDFHPDIVIYNAGTDVLYGDPLGMLDITADGVIERDQFVFSTCRRLKIPIVMLLSGGYLKSSAKVISDSILNLKSKGLLFF